MITESPVELPQEEVMGQKLRIHFNHSVVERLDEDGNSITAHRYETAITHVDASRASRVKAIVGSRYSVDDELSLINNRGARQGEYADYLAFREQAKALSGGASDVRSAAIGRINAGYEIAMTKLASEYPRREEATFYIQEAEAKAWLSDNMAETPFLDALAGERGVTKEFLADRVAQKAALYTAKAGQLTGLRQRLEDSIFASTTDAELSAIEWPLEDNA